MAVRLSRKDLERIRKTNNFIRNKKKRILDNYNIDVKIFPIDIKNIKSRKQLNDFYDSARRFRNSNRYRYRKNKYGFVISNYDYNQMKYLVDRVNTKRRRAWNKVKHEEFKVNSNVPIDLATRRWMEPNRYGAYNLMTFNFQGFRDLKQWNNRREHLKLLTRDSYYRNKNEQLKENILNAIATHWGIEGYDAYQLIDSMSADDVVHEFETNDIFSFDTFGSPDIFSREQLKDNMKLFYKQYGHNQTFFKAMSGSGKRVVV